MDCTLLRSGGIGRYLRELLSFWLQRSDLERIFLLGSPKELHTFLEKEDTQGISEVIPWMGGPYSLRRHLGWVGAPSHAAATADITFFPHYDVPFLKPPMRYVVTVHDLTHFLLPGVFPAWKTRGGRRLLNKALRNAAGVVTVSESSRRDLLAWGGGVGEGQVTVVPNGVSEIFFRPSIPDAETNPTGRWEALRPYLLTVGSARPHKNLEMAVEVLAGILPFYPTMRLLLAGEDGERSKTLLRQAERLGIAERVIPVGVLDDLEMYEIYRRAEVVLLPSRYEGFGLPALEAMALGVPLVSSNVASLPEVVGEDAPLLGPEDGDGWIAATRRILDEERDAVTASRPRERAGRFRWEHSADLTFRAIQTALDSK